MLLYLRHGSFSQTKVDSTLKKNLIPLIYHLQTTTSVIAEGRVCQLASLIFRHVFSAAWIGLVIQNDLDFDYDICCNYINSTDKMQSIQHSQYILKWCIHYLYFFLVNNGKAFICHHGNQTVLPIANKLFACLQCGYMRLEDILAISLFFIDSQWDPDLSSIMVTLFSVNYILTTLAVRFGSLAHGKVQCCSRSSISADTYCIPLSL